VAAFVDEVLRPESTGGTQEGGAVGPVFDGGGDGGGRAGAAERATEGAGFEAAVGADGFAALIKDAHHVQVPSDPDFVADVFGGDFVIGAGDFHEAVAPDFAAGFFVNREEGGREWLQEGALLGEVLGDLAFGGAVDAGVGDCFFPMGEVGVLGGETLEVVAFERAVFDIADAAFDFAFVLGRVGTAWHDAGAVVSAEGFELGIDIRIEPVGAQHGGFQIVDIEDLGHAAEVPEGVFQTAQKGFRILAEHGFAVTFARKAQHDAQDVRAAFFFLGVFDHRALTKVDLRFLAGGAFQAVDALWLTLEEFCNKALHGLVGASEAKAVAQLAVDALGAQARLKAACDEGCMIAAQAFASRDRRGFRPDFEAFRRGLFARRAGGHFSGAVWRRIANRLRFLLGVGSNRAAVEPKFQGDAPQRPAFGVKFGNGGLFAHF